VLVPVTSPSALPHPVDDPSVVPRPHRIDGAGLRPAVGAHPIAAPELDLVNHGREPAKIALGLLKLTVPSGGSTGGSAPGETKRRSALLHGYKLTRTGKAKVTAKVTYTPDGGDSNTEGERIKLIQP
jgi:hypothetical protein